MIDSYKSTQEDSRMPGCLLNSEQENYLRIFENFSKPVILLTGDYKVKELNCAAVELFRNPNSIGANACGEKDGPETMPWLTEEVTRFTDDGKQKELFIKEFHSDQGSRYFEVELIRISDTNGTLVFLNEITEQTRTQVALR